jgi:hypothetical protein
MQKKGGTLPGVGPIARYLGELGPPFEPAEIRHFEEVINGMKTLE